MEESKEKEMLGDDEENEEGITEKMKVERGISD